MSSDNQYALTERVTVTYTVLVSPALLDSITQYKQNEADTAGQLHRTMYKDDVSVWFQADSFGTSIIHLPYLLY
jgi:hypothetical protein